MKRAAAACFWATAPARAGRARVRVRPALAPAWVPRAADTFEAECEAPAAGGFAGAVASIATSCWAIDVADERVAVLLLPHATFVWACRSRAASPRIAWRRRRRIAGGAARTRSRANLVAGICGVEGARAAIERLPAAELGEWSRAARAWTLNVRAAGKAARSRCWSRAARIESLAPARGVPRRPRARLAARGNRRQHGVAARSGGRSIDVGERTRRRSRSTTCWCSTSA